MPGYRIINGTLETLRAAGINRTARGRFAKGNRGRLPEVPLTQAVGILPTVSDFERSEIRIGFWLTRSNAAERRSVEVTREWNRRTSETRWETTSQEVYQADGRRFSGGPIACGTPEENYGRGARPGTGQAHVCSCPTSPNPWITPEGKVRDRRARGLRHDDPGMCLEHGTRQDGCPCGGISANSGYSTCAGHRVSLKASGTRDLFRAFPTASEAPDREPYVPKEADCRIGLSTSTMAVERTALAGRSTSQPIHQTGENLWSTESIQPAPRPRQGRRGDDTVEALPCETPALCERALALGLGGAALCPVCETAGRTENPVSPE